MNEITILNKELKDYLESLDKFCEVRNDQVRQPEEYIIKEKKVYLDSTSEDSTSDSTSDFTVSDCIPVILFNIESKINSQITQMPGKHTREVLTFSLYIIDKQNSSIKNLVTDIMKFESRYLNNISVTGYKVNPHPNSPELYKIIELNITGILHCTYF